jgi:hypothetical protein
MHAYVGMVSLLLVVLAPMAGYMQFKLKDMRVHAIHKLFGRLPQHLQEDTYRRNSKNMHREIG